MFEIDSAASAGSQSEVQEMW